MARRGPSASECTTPQTTDYQVLIIPFVMVCIALSPPATVNAALSKGDRIGDIAHVVSLGIHMSMSGRMYHPELYPKEEASNRAGAAAPYLVRARGSIRRGEKERKKSKSNEVHIGCADWLKTENLDDVYTSATDDVV
ncbi:hypothetical protein DFH06DRAFT_1150422 [Mycena polygramma]|nr:hypothetical protein DFH06DRAFT_1150422 [Mycena polygramma]